MNESVATLGNDKTHETFSKTTFGFWVYLMTDCVLFATLFATYAVLRNNTFGGPSGGELFSLPYVLVETLILLTSSLTCGLAMLAAHHKNTRHIIGWLAVTALLGLSFLFLELNEFRNLVAEGQSWRKSAFLSSFFTLVATHGLHIASGLIWIGAMIHKLRKVGLTSSMMRKLTTFSLFWHFLDVVWIFIFTVVYLMGAV